MPLYKGKFQRWSVINVKRQGQEVKKYEKGQGQKQPVKCLFLSMINARYKPEKGREKIVA